MGTLSFKIALKNNLYGVDQSDKFFCKKLQLNEDMVSLKVRVLYNSSAYCQLPFALFDPDRKLRILKTGEGGVGIVETECSVSHNSADKGGIPGVLKKGTWILIIHKRRMGSNANADICVTWKEGRRDVEPTTLSFSKHIIKKTPGWYCGELHVHSNHSTGRDSIATILEVAKKEKLDFISITDHFTVSHWMEEEFYKNDEILMLQAMELSGDRGHANLQGIKEMKNPYVDDDGFLAQIFGVDNLPDMANIADEVHNEGGLFTINHADGDGISAWRYHDFPLEKADLFEAWTTATKDFSMRLPAIWDNILNQGIRLIGVASSDSHKATEHPFWALGKLRTWVYAKELSQKGIIEGLKRGNVYMAKGDTRLIFEAISNPKVYHMGEVAGKAEDTVFHIKLENVPRGNLFIYIGGQLENSIYFKDGAPIEYEFSIKSKLTSLKEHYVRIEYYEMPQEPKYWGDVLRTQSTLLLLSNPIWLKK